MFISGIVLNVSQPILQQVGFWVELKKVLKTVFGENGGTHFKRAL